MADELRTKVIDIALRLNAKIFGTTTDAHKEFLIAQSKEASL